MRSKALRTLLHAVVFMVLSLPVTGQEFPMIHYGMEEGLPSNIVYQVYRDSKGFLWFGTDKGIARYNGVKFEIFTTFNGLPDNEVFFFREDLYGRLWLGTFNGELCFYKDDTFHTAANTPFLKLSFKSSHIKIITPQKDSSVIIAYYNQGSFLNIHHEQCEVINITDLTKNDVNGRLIYRQKITPNRYKLTFANTALIIDTNEQIKQRFSVDTFDIPEGHGNNSCFTSCQNQEYLYNNRYVYTTEMQMMRKLPPDFNDNNFILEFYFNRNYAFYATNNGLYIDDSIHVLKEYSVSSVSNDNQGNYWISTLSNGVYVLRKYFYNSRLYKNAYEGKVRFSHAAKGHLIYAITNNNLYDIENGKQTCLLNYASLKQRKYNIPLEPGYFIDNNFRYYNLYNHDYIFMDNIFSKKPRIKYSELFDGIKSLFAINGDVFIKSRNEILRIRNPQKEPGDIVRFQSIGNPEQGERIFGFGKDENDLLWYSTVNSIYKIIDTNAILQTQFKHTPFKYFDFLGNRLIGYTHDNQLIICSNVNSAVVVDSVVNQNCIWDKFYKLDDYHMLISTNNLYRLLSFDDLGSSRKFKMAIIQNPFLPLHAESVCSDKQHCYFFKDGQVTYIDINSLLADPAVPKLYFTLLKAGNLSCTIHDEVRIPFADSRNMNISFSTLSMGGDKVTYQYSVSKNDRDNWVDVSGEDISLINSGYGSYKIKIKAKTISSDYCKPTEFTLVVLHPFWATWWFIIFCACMLTIIIVLISRKRLALVLSKKDKAHEMQVRFMKSEYKALNALMNPHFIFNTLNNVQGLINKNDKLAANEYLRVIADLIRQNMHNISKELIPLQKEIDLITNYLLLEKLRFKEKLNYSIIIEKGLDLSDIMVPPLLIQPLIENSIKHGILPLDSPEGAIYINIYERKSILYIEVRDNGVGLIKSKLNVDPLHESFGLENIRKRIEQLSIIQNKEITFNFSERKNTIGKLQWTIVTISMPISE